MKTRIFVLVVWITIVNSLLFGQLIQHPWHVVDRGGGKSTAGVINLHSSIGQPVVQKGSAGGISLEGGFIPGVRVLEGTTSSADANLQTGWIMVSVPLIVSDYRKTLLYPSARSSAFFYEGAYHQKDTLRLGYGYWLKYVSPDTEHFSGTSATRETIDVRDRWNMIGCLSYAILPADIQPIPPTSINSNYYGYVSGSGYYKADTLFPSRGYWIKVINAGKLVLKTGSLFMEPTARGVVETKMQSSQSTPQEPQNDFNRLIVHDNSGREQTLFFTASNNDLDLAKYELPPIAPDAILDVRYASHRNLEIADRDNVKEFPLLISYAEYPLTIHWRINDPAESAELLLNGKGLTLKGEGASSIKDPVSSIKLRLSPLSAHELPKEFALQQNYPNPFNPVTVIRYQIPDVGAGHVGDPANGGKLPVQLKVYNMLGQEVAVLVDGMQEAGYKSVEWNASEITSGVYFYRLIAGSFTDVRKMLMIK